MKHHLDISVASDLSQRVLELRRLRGELGSQALDSSNQTLYALPSQLVDREVFTADRESVRDGFQGDAGLWRHGRKGQR